MHILFVIIFSLMYKNKCHRFHDSYKLRDILIKLFITLRHISLHKSNQLFTTNKRSWMLLLDDVARLFAFIASLKL